MKFLLLLSYLFISTSICGQSASDFKNEISTQHFKLVRKHRIPLSIIKLLGCDNYRVIGTKEFQEGCTSGKNIVILWAVKDDKGLWVMHMATCGRASNDHYYIISDNKLIEVYIHNKDLMTFDDFKVAYSNY